MVQSSIFQTDIIQYCFWDAKSLIDTLFITFNLIVVTIMLLIIAVQFKALYSQIKGNLCRSKSLLFVYGLLFFWGLSSFIQNSYSILTYFIRIHGQQYDQITKYKNQFQWSRIYSILDPFPAFFVQTLLVTIPMIFYIQLTMAETIPSTRSHKLTLVIKLYSVLRVIIFITGIALISIAQDDDVQMWNSVNVIMLVTDCFCCNIILLVYGRQIMKKLDSLHLKQSQRQKRKLKFQYSFLAICGFLRLIIDLVFFFAISFDDDRCIEPFDSHILYTLIYTFSGNFIMHFLPIFRITRLYRFSGEEDDDELNRTILIQSIDE